MSVSPAEQTPAADAAATLREATFVRLRVSASGAAVAAAGVIGRALRTLDVPFRIRATDAPDTVANDDVVAVVGLSNADADLELDPTDAVSIVRELGVDPDPAVALAGFHAAGVAPDDDLADAAADAGVEAGPGVAVPTGDLADGLAHSTLVHASFSADRERAQATLAELSLPAELDADARRRVASLVAIDATTGEATARAATAVERVLRSVATPSGPFETVGGFADVLDATVRESPGTAVALALGHGVRDAALDAWRDHAQATHGALREATTGRYESLYALSCDLSSPGRLATVARLARDFRSPEPTVLAVGVGAAALVSTGPAGLDEDLAAAADELPDASATGSPSEATMTFDSAAEPSDVVAAVREVRR
ncbi:putative replication complex protein RecJ2 [Haloferax gibbonsii]|uniref:Replication complex protein RecJ2 n=1 Tax=Haloferax gibbonsii TaxID=35746 RepID=A0A871BDX0_HALGI|nr:exonuclease [Haloferax gibbonsii]QOS11317.1 putative replication complex protein RecJ2 [Haloferax gibbonsii]